MGKPTLPLGMRECPLGDLLPLEGPKLHPQKGQRPVAYLHPSRRVIPTPFSHHFSPRSSRLSRRRLYPYPINTQAPCLLGVRFEVCSPISLLGCFARQPFAANLSVSVFGLLCIGTRQTWLTTKKRNAWIALTGRVEV